MFEKVNHITLSGKEFPVWCDMAVLELIQDKYGDIAKFEEKLSKFTPRLDENGEPLKNEEGFILGNYRMPGIKEVNDALYWMVSEGLEIEAEEEGKELKKMTRKQLLRLVDIPPIELGNLLHKEFARCFERKNENPTETMN